MIAERISKALRHAPLNVVIALIAFTWLLPSVGLLVSSFRPESAVITTGWWTVFRHPFDFTQMTLNNYASVITRAGMGRAFLNSLIISVPSTIVPITVAAFAAYAFSWMEFPGREWIFIVVVGLIVVPLQMTLIPILRIYNRLGLAGTFVGIWLAHTGYGLPYAVYLLRNFIGALPKDLLESASLDGASHTTAFLRLVVPLSIPAIASIAIFQFLWVWNDLLVALVYLGGTEAVAPVTVKMSSLVNSLGQDWHLLTAAAFVSMVLPLVVFFSLQRYFVRGILAGSIKG